MKTNSKSKIYRKLSLWYLAGLAVLLITGCSPSQIPVLTGTKPFLESSKEITAPQDIATPAIDVPANESILALESTLEQVYEKVSPSVVNIRVVMKVTNQEPGSDQNPLFPFFNLPEGEDQSPELYESGLGSGFIWDTQGHIVTNNHVIDSADKIEATLSDGTILPAELVGADPDSDLAVLKVDLPAEITPAELADSSALKVGQFAIAIGNPFGLEGTMTVGIISALGRSLPTSESLGPTYTIPDIIQTDAPINPGNSGGVLVNDQGQVIGVPAAIESPVQANAGIGFAIPAGIVNKVVPVLIAEGHFDHSWLGISGTSLVPDLANAMDLESTQRGVLVIDVMPNSPAEKAGLQGSGRQIEIDGAQARVGGDVIVAIDGQTLREMDDLIAYLAGKTEVGQQVKLTILRDGKEETLSATLAARPVADEESQSPSTTTQGAHLGISGLDVNEAIAQAMNLPEGTQGVLVEQVEAGSPADKAGLRGSYKPTTINGEEILVGGDIITAIEGKPVATIQELRTVLSQIDAGGEVSLSILRNGKEMSVGVTLGE